MDRALCVDNLDYLMLEQQFENEFQQAQGTCTVLNYSNVSEEEPANGTKTEQYNAELMDFIMEQSMCLQDRKMPCKGRAMPLREVVF